MLRVPCPGCGRSLRLSDDNADFIGRCPSCSQRFRLGDLLANSGDAGIPEVLAAEPEQRIAARPSTARRDRDEESAYDVRADEDSAPPRRRAAKRRRVRDRASDTRILGLNPFFWILLAVAFVTFPLLLLALFFTSAADMLMAEGVALLIGGTIWFAIHAHTHYDGDFQAFPARILYLTGVIGYFFYQGYHALQDLTGLGRPYLLEIIGVVLLIFGGICYSLDHSRGPFADVFHKAAATAPPPGQPRRQAPPPITHQPPSAKDFAGLLAYWSFDEGNGVQAADSSGNGQHARLVNGRWTDGIRGKALSLNGEGSYLDYSDAGRLSFAAHAPFTLALWLRTIRPQGTLLSQRHSRDGSALIDILLKDGRVQTQLRQDGNELAGVAAIEGFAVNEGGWHHLALTRDGNRIALYLDGIVQGETRNDLARGALTTDLRALGSERYWIRNGFAFGDPHFQGEMDEFCVFNRVLTANEITALAGR